MPPVDGSEASNGFYPNDPIYEIVAIIDYPMGILKAVGCSVPLYQKFHVSSPHPLRLVQHLLLGVEALSVDAPDL